MSTPFPMPDPTQGIIHLDVVVKDKSGRPVSELTEKDFSLLDNGQPQKLVTFKAFDEAAKKPVPPIEVILVIDELSLPTRLLADAEKEAEAFLRRNGGHLEQPVTIYRISDGKLRGTADTSTDGNFLADVVANRREPRSIGQSLAHPTPIRCIGPIGCGDGPFFETYDEVGRSTVASDKLPQSLVALGSIAIEERRKPGRKLMFWLGLGWRLNQGKSIGVFDNLTEFSTRLREARIELWRATEWPSYDDNGHPVPIVDYIYPDYLRGGTSQEIDVGILGMQVIAALTGGGELETRNDLGEAIGKRVDEASRFYTLTFDPPRTNVVDEYHSLKVIVNRDDLTAHTRTGYYDEPVYYDQSPDHIERVTVAQLEDEMGKVRRTVSDSMEAHRLDRMELTERLNSTKLGILEDMVGRKARQALIALADQSVFLAPPAEEIAATPPPTVAEKRQIIARAIEYVNQTIPKLPDLIAGRTTMQFLEHAEKSDTPWKTADGDQSLHAGEISKATVHFSNGREVVEKESVKGTSRGQALNTMGTFGPILANVFVGATAPQSQLTWSRWERGANGLEAVFDYRVPQQAGLFVAGFCCLAIDEGQYPFENKAPFHGEFAIDPDSGAVLRLTVQADLWRLPLEQSGVMVEYGPLTLGGKTFICPKRSVSISRQRRIMNIAEWHESFKVYAPFETILNDMSFHQYRFFGSTARMLPGFTEVPANH
jgi:VWFA-related protein